jgi:hypothetical protein
LPAACGLRFPATARGRGGSVFPLALALAFLSATRANGLILLFAFMHFLRKRADSAAKPRSRIRSTLASGWNEVPRMGPDISAAVETFLKGTSPEDDLARQRLQGQSNLMFLKPATRCSRRSRRHRARCRGRKVILRNFESVGVIIGAGMTEIVSSCLSAGSLFPSPRLPMTCFCNSLEISMRVLAVQGAAIFNRRLLESGRFQTAPPWFFHVIPHQKSPPAFSKSSG